MGIQMSDGKMEGWLHLIRFNRFGLQYSRKRYFILENNCLNSFKSIPTSVREEPLRSAIIDSCVRVVDNGRESFKRKVFFIFTLYNTSNQNDQLKFGATSPKEAARWIRSLKDAALKPGDNSIARRIWQPFRLSETRTVHKKFVDWTSTASMHVDAMTSDVISPSPWKIFGCQNGLRLFKEAKDRDSSGRHWDDHPAIMAVGVVDGNSEAVFRTLMSLGPSRSEWDFSVYRGSLVEHLNGHTDIIHVLLYKDYLPWGKKRRDLLLRRYWRRADDGTYVILYHSVFHRKCPPHPGYVRATLKSGGFVVSPVNQGKESVVKHMLAIDWKCWRFYLTKASGRSMTICMLIRVAALREMFKAKAGNYTTEFSLGEVPRDVELPQEEEKEDIKTEVDMGKKEKAKPEDETNTPLSCSSSLLELNDASDEFFDVPEPSDDEQLEHEWSSPQHPYVQESYHSNKLSSAANFVKKLHDLAVQKKGYMDLQELAWKNNVSFCYGATFLKDSSCQLPCSWSSSDPSTFLIRGDNYLKDHKKIKAKGSLMQMVAADWIKSDKREDDLAGRPGGIVQKYEAQGAPEFFFVINIQVPGTTTYSLALYYMMRTPLEECPLLENFVNGDDAFRNSRFKLIPHIAKGSWIVKQSVGKKACLVGRALEVNYCRGKNYLELDIDVGSSTVARGVVSLVLGYLNNLVIEMAFLIQIFEDHPGLQPSSERTVELQAALHEKLGELMVNRSPQEVLVASEALQGESDNVPCI